MSSSDCSECCDTKCPFQNEDHYTCRKNKIKDVRTSLTDIDVRTLKSVCLTINKLEDTFCTDECWTVTRTLNDIIELYEDPNIESEEKFSEIPDYGNLMTIEIFKECCECNVIMNDDGYGNYAFADKRSEKEVDCNDFCHDTYDKKYTHVVWFNK